MGLGNDVGKAAAEEIRKAAQQATTELHATATDAIHDVATEVMPQIERTAVEASGSLERAAGALCLALGGFPESLVSALDGLTVEINATIRVIRKGM